MRVELISFMGSEQSIANSARVSFSSTKRKRSDEDLIRFLMKNNHMSPFEMAEFVFLIECPIFVARQILRHRTASVSEVSGRHNQSYFKMFYLPKIFRYQSKENKQRSEGKFENIHLKKKLVRTYLDCYDTYQEMLNSGVARELARIVLPVSTYTKFVWKMDLRNLLNFLRERLAPEAQHEVRYVARMISEHVKEKFPNVWLIFSESSRIEQDDGFDESCFEIYSPPGEE